MQVSQSSWIIHDKLENRRTRMKDRFNNKPVLPESKWNEIKKSTTEYTNAMLKLYHATASCL
jgi:hypothetical protein